MSSRTPRFWIVTLATLVTMGGTGALGLWQIGRAQQKLDLQARIEAQAQLPSWRETELLASADPLSAVHRPVQLRGEWVSQASVFLDNRQMNARPGFFLVTPLRLKDSNRSVLVQRGWVPRDFTDRSRLPRIETPSGEVDVVGRLAPPPGQLYQIGPVSAGPIRQNIELAAFAQESGLDLLTVSVLQTEGPAEGLMREWPVAALGVDRNHGYAFQWFGLCALAGFLYVWFQFIAPRRKRLLHAPDA
jgi:surfeit locus 1 family protein